MHRWSFAVFLALAALTGAAAYPTLYGPTGLVTLPDARIAESRLSVAADVDELPGRRTFSVRATTPLAQGEVGALFASDPQTTWGAHGKYPLAAWPGGSLAVGALYLAPPEITTRQGYLAGTQAFSPRLAGTLGVTWTEVATVAGAAAAVRPYAGISFTLGNDLVVVGEYQAADSAFFESRPLCSLMIIRQSSRPVSFTVGTSNALNTLGGSRDYFFAGMLLRIDGS